MRIFKILLNIIIISFLLNFSWEFLQSPFYECFNNTFKSNYLHYILAILGDSMYTIIIYIITSIINKDLLWIINSWNRKNILMIVVIGFIVAIFIEYKGVFILHKWNYSGIMPTILGIGIIPILQMMILPIMSFRIARKFN